MTPKYVGEVIGVGDVYIAPIEKDSQGEYKAGTPFILAPNGSVAEDTPTNTKIGYYSNNALFIFTSEGATKLTIVIPGLTTEAEAMLLGKQYDSAKGMMYDSGSPIIKYFALGFRSDYAKEEGGEGQRFVWFGKGSFAIPKKEGSTKTDQVDNKPLTIEYSAISTIHKFELDKGDGTADKPKVINGFKRVQADTSNPAFTGSATWFDAVVTPPEVPVTP